jgi:CBS domain-containing protein
LPNIFPRKNFFRRDQDRIMGEQQVKKLKDSPDRIAYLAKLIDDIEALENMLSAGAFAKAPLHIGAEQELCLIDGEGLPALRSLEVLERLKDPRFTHELALYNLEINLDPLELGGRCFSEMHKRLNALLAEAEAAANEYSVRTLLTGIMPTLSTRHMNKASMTPVARYEALDQAIREMRKEHIELHIQGVDEVNLHHDSILYEGCNTSFQVHLQIDPDDFRDTYNWAQAIAGPVLSVCTNSPLLMGKELWEESRIALFSQSVDTRASTFYLDEQEARVGFGNGWATGSAADFYKESIVRFRSLLNGNIDSLSTSDWKARKVPKLKALRLHNGTVYPWNRLCYGVTAGKPHLRIENRYLSSGPSTTDEIANMMLWVGIMSGRPEDFNAIHSNMDFRDAKSNFYQAARYGIAAQHYWEGKLVPSGTLMTEVLLPIAHEGLRKMKVDAGDIEKYLSVITNRIAGMTGSRWMVKSYRALRNNHSKPDALKILTETIYDRQRKDLPVANWALPKTLKTSDRDGTRKLGDVMQTRILTAQEDDSAELVFKIMQWQQIHHVPILDARSALKGIISWSDKDAIMEKTEGLRRRVRQFMSTHLITATHDTSLEEARTTMETNGIHCLPVLENGKLLGIVTSNDI